MYTNMLNGVCGVQRNFKVKVMKKLLVLILVSVAFIFNFSAIADLSDLNENSKVYRVSDSGNDTINFYERVFAADDKFLMYCENWCRPCYKELNRLYSEGVIDSLLDNNVSLIIISGRYPFLNLNHYDIKDFNKRILRDFEIYYDTDFSVLREISGGNAFPFYVFIMDGEVVLQNIGLKSTYKDILPLITRKSHN